MNPLRNYYFLQLEIYLKPQTLIPRTVLRKDKLTNCEENRKNWILNEFRSKARADTIGVAARMRPLDKSLTNWNVRRAIGDDDISSNSASTQRISHVFSPSTPVYRFSAEKRCRFEGRANFGAYAMLQENQRECDWWVAGKADGRAKSGSRDFFPSWIRFSCRKLQE